MLRWTRMQPWGCSLMKHQLHASPGDRVWWLALMYALFAGTSSSLHESIRRERNGEAAVAIGDHRNVPDMLPSHSTSERRHCRHGQHHQYSSNPDSATLFQPSRRSHRPSNQSSIWPTIGCINRPSIWSWSRAPTYKPVHTAPLVVNRQSNRPSVVPAGTSW